MSYNEKKHRRLVIESVIKDARCGREGYACDEDELEVDGPVEVDYENKNLRENIKWMTKIWKPLSMLQAALARTDYNSAWSYAHSLTGVVDEMGWLLDDADDDIYHSLQLMLDYINEHNYYKVVSGFKDIVRLLRKAIPGFAQFVRYKLASHNPAINKSDRLRIMKNKEMKKVRTAFDRKVAGLPTSPPDSFFYR